MFRNTGNQNYVDENYNECLKNYQLSIDNKEDDIYLTFRNLTHAHLKLDDLDSALVNIKLGVKDNNEDSASWLLLANILELQDKSEEAAVAINQANSLQLDNSDTESEPDEELKVGNTDQLNILPEVKLPGGVNLPEGMSVPEGLTMPSQDEMMNTFMNNDMLKSKLNDENFQKKIMENKNNPFNILQDPEMMSVMSEMAKSFNMK